MPNNEKLLLCTFVKNHLVDKKIATIKDKFDLKSDLFVLGLKDREDESIITYNITPDFNYKNKIKHTINLHRKRETNTLYTINALNEIIKKENGTMDENYEVNWEDYENSLVITRNGGLSVIGTTLKKRV